jgi:predicted nucleotidyltransferase
MFGLYPNSYKEMLAIFQKYKTIEKVIIYGSRAKGNYKEGSDIDLTLFGDLNYDLIIKLKQEFEESTIPYLVDISIYKDLQSETLKEHIDRVGKIFYEINSNENN